MTRFKNMPGYGALVLKFWDGCAEDDGEHVFRRWQLMLPHFKAAGQKSTD